MVTAYVDKKQWGASTCRIKLNILFLLISFPPLHRLRLVLGGGWSEWNLCISDSVQFYADVQSDRAHFALHVHSAGCCGDTGRHRCCHLVDHLDRTAARSPHSQTNTHFSPSIPLMHQILPWGSVIVTMFKLERKFSTWNRMPQWGAYFT